MIELARQLVGRSAALLPYLGEAGVTDILINGTQSLYVERNGALEREDSPFSDAASLADFMERLLVPIGRRVDAAQPYLDGRLSDGTRFHLILPPLARPGPLISLRKFRDAGAAALSSFSSDVTLTRWLEAQVAERRNILISGGTGTGKTTLLCRLLERVSEAERIVVVEESGEIRVRHPHVVFLEARPATPDGVGEVTLRQLVRNTLRMRPDRIVLGECRGGEAFDMLQALNTGHRGGLCTIHANGALEALKRLEGLALLAGLPLSPSALREWVASAIDVVVHVARAGAARHIAEVIQVEGMEGEVYRFLPRFSG